MDLILILMMFMPSSLLFLIVLFISILMVISSPSWLGAWVGLEINLISFIPIMIRRSVVVSVESAMKYFLVQAFSSLLLLISILLSLSDINWIWFNFDGTVTILLVALMIKLGAAPFHFWFPAVVSGISWGPNFILITIQKLGPLFILHYLWGVDLFLIGVITTRVVIGRVGGLNQSSLRKLMAYSSINHLGWILAASYFRTKFVVIYFIIYLVTNGLLIQHLSIIGFYYISHIFYYTGSNLNSLILNANWLSFGGLPPFIGFFRKWVVIQALVESGLIVLAILIISIRLVSLFYYTRVCYVIISQSLATSLISNLVTPTRVQLTHTVILFLLGLTSVPLLTFVM